jgi:LacI family transcriptional regulator
MVVPLLVAKRLVFLGNMYVEVNKLGAGQRQAATPVKGDGKRRWTITDVAARAGVSIGTASKALNGRGRLRAETRSRVLRAAESLGFEPNALARSLIAGRSFTVGLVTTDSFGRFSIPVMLGAEDALGEGSVSVFLCDGRGDPERERRYLRTLLSRRVDGIIVAARRVDPRPPVGTDLPVPVVYAMAQSEDRQDLSVLPDDEGGGHLAVKHLLEQGRSHIGHISGPEHFEAARRRAGGAKAELSRAGLTMAGEEVLFGGWSEAWGREATALLLEREPATDAIFCGSDQIARGVADALRESGRRVPDDLALVGFDNWDVMAQACRPPLTTIDPNLSEVGRVAARELLAAIEGTAPGGVRTVACKLVVRESTAGATVARVGLPVTS